MDITGIDGDSYYKSVPRNSRGYSLADVVEIRFHGVWKIHADNNRRISSHSSPVARLDVCLRLTFPFPFSLLS